MEPFDSRLHHLGAHVDGDLDSKGFHGFVVVLDGFQSGFELSRHNRLAKLGHPFESRVVLNRQQSRKDGYIDPIGPAFLEPFNVHVRVVEELGDDVVAAGLDFVNQVLVVFFFGRVVDVAFGVARDADAVNERTEQRSAKSQKSKTTSSSFINTPEVVSVLLANVLDEVDGVRESRVDGLPVFLSARRVTTQSQDVLNSGLFGFLVNVSSIEF